MHSVQGPVMGRRAALAAFGVAALGASGCVGASEQGTDAAQEASYFEASVAAPSCLDPGAAADRGSLQVMFQLFEPLCTYDFTTDALVGAAAARYEVSEDARTFTFWLRDATFHNGDPVTAASFKRAWERLVNPMSARSALHGDAPQAWRLALVEGYDALREGSASGLSGVTCPDERTLVVRLAEPYADFCYLVTHPALAPVPAPAEDDAAAFAASPVGNGPFAMDGPWEAGAPAIRLKAFAAYRTGAPAIERLRFTVEDDVVTAYQAFLTGASDVSPCPVEEVSAAISRHGRSEDDLTLEQGARCAVPAELGCAYLACNTAAAPLDDASVRRALSLAIDRADLCTTVYRGVAEPASDILSPCVRAAAEEPWAATEFDLERAQELLDDSFPRGEDGMRPLAVSIVYHADGGHQKVMERVADQLEALGVPCELEPLDADTLAARLAAGDYTLARLDAPAVTASADTVLYPLFHSTSARNVMGFADDEVDRLLAEARTTVDEAARAERYRAADARIAEAMPVIPLVFPARAQVASDAVEYLEVDPFGFWHLGGAVVATAAA